MSDHGPDKNDGAYLRGRTSRATVPIGRSVLCISGVILVVTLGTTLLGERGLRRYLDLREERNNLEAEVSALADRHDRLVEDLDNLADDPDALERVARGQYRMLRPGETVIEIVEDTANEDR